MTSAIRAEGLEKRYRDTHALRGLDLEVEEGTVLGVLGPNGAGKTTAVRILATLLRPDAGKAEVAGFDVVKDAEKLRSVIGLTGQYAAVDEHLTGFENLELVGRLYHLPRDFCKKRAGDLLERFDLTDAASRPVKTYSGGMRRRLDLAASLVASPRVLFLDEPTTGLDPRSRLAMWQIISELIGVGTTVLLTTQYLEEADQLANQIAVIDKGTVIAKGTSDELKAQVGGQRLELVVHDAVDVGRAGLIVERYGSGNVRVDVERRQLVISVSNAPKLLTEVITDLAEAGIELDEFGLHRPTLDDVFLSLTGHVAEDAEKVTADEERK